MLLNELSAGAAANLDMIKDSKVYEVSTVVVGVSSEMNNSVLLEPFEYKGNILDLGNKAFDGVTFRLYADDSDGVRVGWMGIDVKLTEYNGRKYYAVTAPTFGSVSRQSDRRNHARVSVGMKGILTFPGVDEKYKIEVCDISDNGISFVSDKKFNIINKPCHIRFAENVNKTSYELDVECQCVRENEESGRYFYGCKVNEQSRRGLAYIYIKKIMSKN